MSQFEEAMAVAVQLPQAERERLAQALGVRSAPPGGAAPGGAPGPGRSLPLQQFVPRPDPVAWRKAETGHAVLNTGRLAVDPTTQDVVEVPEGPDAIAGMWAHRAEANQPEREVEPRWPLAATLPQGQPVVIHTDLCIDLALGVASALRFFEKPPVEVRLATASYLTLLGAAENEAQVQRIRQFVQPYAVLSLGPMASSRAVELVTAHAVADGLGPLDALIAATALAHEIPLVVCNPRPFSNIEDLAVYLPC